MMARRSATRSSGCSILTERRTSVGSTAPGASALIFPTTALVQAVTSDWSAWWHDVSIEVLATLS